MSLKVSVIIPVHNGANTLDECLNSLKANRYPLIEIIVVDDCSTDSSIYIAEKYKTKTIKMECCCGPAAARNRGACAADGDILLFIDSDVKVRSDAIEKTVRYFENRNIDAITGLFTDTQRYNNFASRYKNLWMHHTYARLHGNVSLFYTSVSAIRRDVFFKAGMFDEDYRIPSVEDTEFGHRLSDGGWKITIAKDLIVEHIKKYSIKSLLRTDAKRSSALTRLFIRNRMFQNKRNSTSVPSSFIAGMAILPVSIFFLIIGFIGMNPPIRSVGIAGYFIYLFMNREFLSAIRMNCGSKYLVAGILAMTMDTLAAVGGVFLGFTGYIIGRRY